MDKSETLDSLYRHALVAVVRASSMHTCLDLVAALVRGGVRLVEITFTTPQAHEAAGRAKEAHGDGLILGMGTITRREQVAQAIDAGAAFLVSPHLEADAAKAMVDSGAVAMIGALTPNEVMASFRAGSDVVKLFPGSLGGPEYLRSLRVPYPEIRLMPTGGVNVENAAEWLRAGAFAVGAGGSLCSEAVANNHGLDEITSRAQAFLAQVAMARPIE